MMKLMPIVCLACLVVSGCAEPPGEDAPANARASSYVWQTSARPYVLVGIGESNVPRFGDQTRTAKVVFEQPSSREGVEAALQEIYLEFKKDIEEAQSDAKYRRISIQIYDSQGDVENDPDGWLCSLSSAPDAEVPLPEWPAEAVRWQWRAVDSRPTERERAIEWDYLGTLRQIDLSRQFPVDEADLAGMTPLERRAFLENRYAAEARDLKGELASANGLTVEELERLLERIAHWKYAGVADASE